MTFSPLLQGASVVVYNLNGGIVHHASQSSGESLLSSLFQRTAALSDSVSKEPKIDNYTLKFMDTVAYFEELPPIVQRELKDKYSSEITIIAFLFDQMLYMTSKLSKECPSTARDFFNDFSVLIPCLFYFYDLLSKNKPSPNNEMILQLSEVLATLIQKMEGLSPLLKGKMPEELLRLRGIVEELKNSLSGSGLKFEHYSCLLSNVIGRTVEPGESLEGILEKSSEVALFFQQVPSLFIEISEVSSPKEPIDHRIWLSVRQIFSVYRESIKKQKKKKVTLSYLLRLYHSTYHRLTPFTVYSIMMDSHRNHSYKSLPKIGHSINLNEYKLTPLLMDHSGSLVNDENIEENLAESFNDITYFFLSSLIKISTLDLKQEIGFAIEAKAKQDDKIIDRQAVRRLIADLNQMSKELQIDEFPEKSEKMIMIDHNGPLTFTLLLKHLNESVSIIAKLEDRDFPSSVSLLFNALFWVDYQLKYGLENFVTAILEEVKDNFSKITDMNKKYAKMTLSDKLAFKKQQKELKKTLDRIARFMLIFDKYCKPILESIEDFEANFLTKQVREVQEIIVAEEELACSKDPILSQISSNISGTSCSSRMESPEESPPDSTLHETRKAEETCDFTEALSCSKKDKHVKKHAEKKQEKNLPTKIIQVKESSKPIQPFDEIISQHATSVAAEFDQIRSKRELGEYVSIHNVKWRDLVQEVLDAGYKFLRAKGGHFHYKNPEHPEAGLITIPVHGKKDTVSPGVVKEVRELIN